MPKNKFQEVIFTLIMVFFMVYAMICYNISLNTGSMTNRVFLDAFHELVIMGPIAFILDFFIVSKLAFGCAMRMVDFKNCHPFSKILAISVPSVAFMCPLMSLAATILFKDAGNQFVAVWLQTTAFNFPMAFFWQLIYAGPIVRFIFRHIFPEKETQKKRQQLCKIKESTLLWLNHPKSHTFRWRLIPYNVLFIFHANLSHRIFESLRLFSLIPAS